MTISEYVDAGLKGEKNNQRIKTGILMSFNKEPIYWYSIFDKSN